MTRRPRSDRLFTCILIVVACLMPVHGLTAQDNRQELADDELIATAREIMAAAKFCSLVTLNESGQPQVRTMDPSAPDDDMVVWRNFKLIEPIAKPPRNHRLITPATARITAQRV